MLLPFDLKRTISAGKTCVWRMDVFRELGYPHQCICI